MSAEKQLRRLGIKLPDPPRPLGAYVPSVRTGDLLFLSGMLPVVGGRPLVTGRLGSEVDLAQGQAAACAAIRNALSVLRAELGSLDRIRRFVRLTVFMRTSPDFAEHAGVADAASLLLSDIFGAKAKHVRMVVGVNSLPAGMPVELELIVEIRKRAKRAGRRAEKSDASLLRMNPQ